MSSSRVKALPGERVVAMRQLNLDKTNWTEFARVLGIRDDYVVVKGEQSGLIYPVGWNNVLTETEHKALQRSVTGFCTV